MRQKVSISFLTMREATSCKVDFSTLKNISGAKAPVFLCAGCTVCCGRMDAQEQRCPWRSCAGASVFMDVLVENCSCIFDTSDILAGRMLLERDV